MTKKICHIHFAHPLFFITLVLVLSSFTTSTTAHSWFKETATYPDHHASNNKCIDKEKHALLHFKSYIRQDPEGLLSTWKDEKEAATNYCCNWSGVTCNNQTGHVTSLDLRFGFLEGKISPLLLNLSYLNHLDLSGNSFSGTIPIFFGSMTQLVYLDLSFSFFSGTIPKFIGSMTWLRYLYLGPNDFSGVIPSELGNLTNLQGLSLDSLSCTIENIDWLSRLSQLEDLDMSGISLSKADNWVNVIQSLQRLSSLSLEGCDLSHVMHPYSSSSVNSSFSSSIVTLSLIDNNLNSSMYRWLFTLTSNKLVELYLSRNKLDGVPKYLGNLCSLTYLSLDYNSMPSKFPNFLKNLSGCTSFTLQVLDVSSSQFTGSLSNDIINFSSLEALYLYNNQLNGTISENVWQLPKLIELDVSSNFLKGDISEKIGKSNIVNVNLSNNSIEGVSLNAHMSNLSNVEHIDLSSCKLGPHFPKWIQTMKNLSRISLANTGILDIIPKDFWNMWPSHLTYLDTSFNNISGMITDLSSNFDHRSSTIDLSSNNFHGRIQNVSSSLEMLDVSRNKFYGEIFFLCQIVDGSLTHLDLSHNSFTGQIPDCLWNFKELKILCLGDNNLSGRLPASIKYLTSLEVLYIPNNSLSGELPSSLQNCTELTFLDLGANKFSGNVPVWIGEKLSRLYALSLTSNNFFKTIPSQLCQLVYLQILDLSMNKLIGNIPSCLNNLTSMVQDGLAINQNVHLSNNNSGGEYVDHAMIKWQGRAREFGKTLQLVKIINLSSNNLTGKIPDELTGLHKLIALDLSKNALHGKIPSKIGKMKALQILDLSRNNLSGRIPSSMSQITLLNYLDISYNNLTGRIPSGTQLQSFEPSRYTGNEGLCGLPLSKYCPGDKEKEAPPVIGEIQEDEEDMDDLQRWFYIGGATGFSIGFWLLCMALLVNRHGRHAFFHFLDNFEDWVYVKVVLFIA
ncbi:hypothetical protein QVD17_01015 [Tagetes erecta]|uniref:Leucine-rich repeat-containing N-terminal plant-type domain-containing protein n=1 Tax=Tagetes erecta TaxID=13708 RepID=A0AAD8L471_TARER|nr:hypothetical protein QVD17_01015 [Tagetes erecta]